MSTETLFGLHAVKAVLERRPSAVQRLWLLKGRDDQRLAEVVALAEQHRISTQRTSREELAQLAGSSQHQGVVAACTAANTLPESAIDEVLDGVDSPLLLVLDQVTDPHNLGACLRSADAAGVAAVIVPKDRSASLTGTVRKVSCGASETVPLIQATNLARALRNLKDRNIWLAGLAGEAEQSLYATDLKGPMALVMGAEGQGMRRLTREHCDFLLRIPMAGMVESLNVSVATGICLFEAVRQRQG